MTRPLVDRVAKIAPGAAQLARYQKGDFPHDVRAGLSVAAVALPVGVAYAQLAGFSPEVGLYSSILPLVAYALFGTSRQLIIGPDAATCALVAAAVAPLAADNPQHYLALSVTLTFLAGLFCIGASFLKLGAVVDFLSKPILIGLMNGIALSILLGQIGKIFGFPIESGGIIPRLFEFASKIADTHWPTLAVGLGAFVFLALTPKVLPRLPAALVTMIAAGCAVSLFGLDVLGVKVVGEIPSGLPRLQWPVFPSEKLKAVVEDAAAIALVSFSSAMMTARSFASKNGYDIDADRELAALGASNIASAFSEGFAVSGADSRTAMNDAAGGRTQVAGLIAAVAVAVVLLFFTGPLKYVPVSALGAVLVVASFSLMDVATLRTLYRVEKYECYISLLATWGVVAVGAIDAILVAVVLALIRFIRKVARPHLEVLGEVDGMPGFHAVAHHPGAKTLPGLVLFRFNSPLVFFNAPHFKQGALGAADAAGPGLRWFVLDAIPITSLDVTALDVLKEVKRVLAARGVELILAGRQAQVRDWLTARGLPQDTLATRHFPTLREAVMAFRNEVR